MTSSCEGSSLPAYLTTRSGKTDPESISSDEALWAAFAQISAMETGTPGLGARILQNHGLSVPDSLALAQHIEASMNDTAAYMQELAENFCAARETTQASQALYVQALQDMDSKTAIRQAALIAKISEIISPAGKEACYAWAAGLKRSLTLVSADHAVRVAMLNVDPAVEIERFCAALRAPKPPTRVYEEVRNGVIFRQIQIYR